MRRMVIAATSRVRISVLYAFAFLGAAWAVLLFARVLGVWQLYFLAVLLAAWGIGRDVYREGLFHPIIIFGGFSLAVVLYNAAWMAVFMNEELPFFGSYTLNVAPNSVFSLISEEVILLTAIYCGYLLVSVLARSRSEPEVSRVANRNINLEPLWLLFYLIGVLALLTLILSSGGFVELLQNLGAKYERAAGRGEIVLLTFFAYVGALLWFKKNVWRSTWQRYSGLILLLLPMLLSGSRTWMLTTLLASAYVDERIGHHINLKVAALSGLVLTVLFAAYQVVRGGSTRILSALYKDLSMGTGYLAALQEGLLNDHLRLDTVWVSLSPFTPTVIKNAMGFPNSPNYFFTQSLFPGSQATFSMGVMGEAHYVLYSGWSILYYLLIGIVLAYAGSLLVKRSLLATAIVAGASWRIVKVGFIQSISDVLVLLAPIVFVYIVVIVVLKALEVRGLRKGQ